MNKRNFFTLFGVLAVVVMIGLSLSGGYSSRSNYIINEGDYADIEDGDTLLSGWYEIGGAKDVAATLEVSDSVTARVDFFYKFGPSGQRIQVAAQDSIGIQNEGGATWTSKGKEYRGFGTGFVRVKSNGDTAYSKIVGANYIQAKVTIGDVNSQNSASYNRVRVGIITND